MVDQNKKTIPIGTTLEDSLYARDRNEKTILLRTKVTKEHWS